MTRFVYICQPQYGSKSFLLFCVGRLILHPASSFLHTPTFRVYPYNSTANVQMSFLLLFHQFFPPQIGLAMPLPRSRIILISSVFLTFEDSSTLTTPTKNCYFVETIICAFASLFALVLTAFKEKVYFHLSFGAS